MRVSMHVCVETGYTYTQIDIFIIFTTAGMIH